MGLHFPSIKCDLMDIFFSMPTCWDGVSLGDDNDHKSHMRYTTDGKVTGPCPEGFPKRLPQIELTINVGVGSYDGTTKSYQLSDGSSDVYHVDFFNGWQEGKLQDIIEECPVNESDAPRNPPCACTPNLNDNVDHLLTQNAEIAGLVCDDDVRRLILDEATTDITNVLPGGSCTGAVVPKSWDQLTDDLFGNTCEQDRPEFEASEDESGDQSEDESEDDTSEDTSADVSEDIPEDPPTISPTTAPISCRDSTKLRYKRKREQNCKWVRKGPVRKVRQKCNRKWKQLKLHEWCPRTCGAKAGVGKCKHLKRRPNKA